MGIIKAVMGSTQGVLADQWKEYFYCEAIPGDLFGVRGRKRVSERSSNTSSDDNVITDGSLIVVADGQIAIAVEQGKAFACWQQPGEYEFSSRLSESVFSGGGLGSVFRQIGRRIAFGGEMASIQRIYYFSTLESGGMEFCTPAPIPFRVKDSGVGLDLTVGVRCEGSFTYRLTDPVRFFNTVCGSFADTYPRSRLRSQMHSEFLTSLQDALGRLADRGMRPSQLSGHAEELCSMVKQSWKDHRGLELMSIGLMVTVQEADLNAVQNLQKDGVLKNPTMAAAHLVGAQAEAMQAAAKNEGGPRMVLGAASAGAAESPSKLHRPASVWMCSCGRLNRGNFCEDCGKKRP